MRFMGVVIALQMSTYRCSSPSSGPPMTKSARGQAPATTGMLIPGSPSSKSVPATDRLQPNRRFRMLKWRQFSLS